MVSATLVVASAFAACAFPEVGFTPTDASPEGAAFVDANTSDDAAPLADGQVLDTSAPPQSDVDPEGGARDAATRDADTVIDRDAGPDGASCGDLAGSFCDCDQDQSMKEAGTCVDPTALRPDCDDFDPLVYPDQDFVAASWDPTSPHTPANDWNCDGTVTKQFNYGVTCALLSNCTEGFATDIACGETATYNFCKGLVVLGLAVCGVDHTETRTQGCR